MELLNLSEQRAMLAFAEFLKNRRDDGASASELTESLVAELPLGEVIFNTPDEGLSPARMAARRFMRENMTLMRLLAQ